MPSVPLSTGLTITNPLILYRALIATKGIEPDPAQHRLALHLQKLYHRLKDYQPEVDFGHRINQINRTVGTVLNSNRDVDDDDFRPSGERKGILSAFRQQKEKAEVTALTRRLTSHETAIELQSPQGLLLYGEVGTGKTLLVDLLADCLPNRKKRRWHFNVFMLETFARLEQLRKQRLHQPVAGTQEEEHSLLWLARDMISSSPILFLDEFQLPDRAASKILSNLFTSFFHLGGVLIATSNRMPEELVNASGVDFAPPPSSRLGLLGSRWGLRGSRSQAGQGESIFAGKDDFANFLEVLKARCEVWDMGKGGRDWRRREAEEVAESVGDAGELSQELKDEKYAGFEPMASGNRGLGYEQGVHVKPQDQNKSKTKATNAATPRQYFVRSSLIPSSHEVADASRDWKTKELRAIYGSSGPPSVESEVPWETSSLRVYGRNLLIPRHLSGVTKWTFDELCCTNLGPADYITIASTFHTLILTDVPVLTILQKNEARRLITLLDSLYEARCKLLINAEAGPDDLFFPETNQPSRNTAGAQNDGDSVHSETFAEIYQDQTSPFRPNISSYEPSASPPAYSSSPLPSSTAQAAAARSILADEDSDFGPVYGTGRGHGRSDCVPGAGNEIGRQGPDFARTGTFTGEDERFAYKRARSRLWEMCGSRWWAREEEGWWRPVGKDVRRWEGAANEPAAAAPSKANGKYSQEDDENEKFFRHGASPFRTSQEPPPKLGWEHAWGMMTWGKKAGAWGKGPNGLVERKTQRFSEVQSENEKT
ncbi:hypothetical protein MMC21_003064 [Puttea exsequens]|nr:hypothetical protein [Puttea exsequens]